MNNRHLFTATLAAAATMSAANAQSKKMNVLFILTDDLQHSAIAGLGNPQVHTPNIDKLIQSGTAFTNIYTNGSLTGALSMPSRAMIMTGRELFGLKRDGQTIPEQHTTLPEMLRSQGYTTFATGKWHSDYKSFNRSFASGENIFFGGMHGYELNGHASPRLVHYDPTGEYKQRPFIGKKFSSEIYADAACDFLSQPQSQPFFAYVAFTSPHDPRNQHPTYAHRYNPDTLNLPPNYLPSHPFDNGEMGVRDEILMSTPRTPEMIRADLANYYSMVSEVDTQIGRVVEALERSGQRDNTIIVFASDNGLAMGQHGLIGKQSIYDHSMRVPLVIVTPGSAKGIKNSSYGYLSDIYPTLSELLSVETPTSVEGRSLASVVGNNKTKGREALLLAYSSFQRAVVSDGWKLAIYNVDGVVTKQLFNLSRDPWERYNLALEPAQAKRLSKMEQLLATQMQAQHDFCNLSDPTWWGKPGKLGWNDAMQLFDID